RAVGLNQDTFRLPANCDAPDLLARRCVDHDGVAGVDIGDERELAVGCQLDSVRSFRADGDRLEDSSGCDVDNRHAAVARMRAPDLAAVRRDVDPFGALAHRNQRLRPLAVTSLLDLRYV